MNPSHHQFINYYHENKDKLLTYLMYRVNFDKMLAEDLLMEVYIKAYMHFDKFDTNKGSFKTWLFALAHNHLITHWRKEKNRRTVSLEALEEKGFEPAYVDDDDSLSKAMDAKKVQYLLSLMKEDERELISLRYLQELSYEEISNIIEKKQGAIRTALTRALKNFAQLHQKLYPSKQ